MVPFGGDHLIAVDMAAKEICLSVPDGLLDDINLVMRLAVIKTANRAKEKDRVKVAVLKKDGQTGKGWVLWRK